MYLLYLFVDWLHCYVAGHKKEKQFTNNNPPQVASESSITHEECNFTFPKSTEERRGATSSGLTFDNVTDVRPTSRAFDDIDIPMPLSN